MPDSVLQPAPVSTNRRGWRRTNATSSCTSCALPSRMVDMAASLGSGAQHVHFGVQRHGPGAALAAARILRLAEAHESRQRRRAEGAPDRAEQGFIADV